MRPHSKGTTPPNRSRPGRWDPTMLHSADSGLRRQAASRSTLAQRAPAIWEQTRPHAAINDETAKQQGAELWRQACQRLGISLSQPQISATRWPSHGPLLGNAVTNGGHCNICPRPDRNTFDFCLNPLSTDRCMVAWGRTWEGSAVPGATASSGFVEVGKAVSIFAGESCWQMPGTEV